MSYKLQIEDYINAQAELYTFLEEKSQQLEKVLGLSITELEKMASYNLGIPIYGKADQAVICCLDVAKPYDESNILLVVIQKGGEVSYRYRNTLYADTLPIYSDGIYEYVIDCLKTEHFSIEEIHYEDYRNSRLCW